MSLTQTLTDTKKNEKETLYMCCFAHFPHLMPKEVLLEVHDNHLHPYCTIEQRLYGLYQ